MKIINLGIFAHIDAGKTTLTENILLDSCLIKELGKVDKQTSHVDTMDLERSMGITIQSTSVRIELENTVINLIDTPGHADFYSEVERVIPVIDGAVVVVSAVEGVQAQTVKILSLLQSQGVRILFFINKLDAVGANASAVIDDIHEQLNMETLVMQTWDTNGKSPLVKRRLDESLFDELQAKSAEKQTTSLSDILLQRNIMPVFVGSAKLSVGLRDVVWGITNFIPERQPLAAEFSALVYKVGFQEGGGRMCYIRVFSGSIHLLERVYNIRTSQFEKVIRLYGYDGLKLKQETALGVNEIGVLCGIQAKVGDILGTSDGVRTLSHKPQSLFQINVIPFDVSQSVQIYQALRKLQEEEPSINIRWNAAVKEIWMDILGEIQLKVLQDKLLKQYSLSVFFGKTSVIYKETPRKKSSISLCANIYTSIELTVEPIERGKGVLIQSEVSTDKLFKKYQNVVITNIYKALQTGTRGHEVTDIQVTITGGKSTPVASNSKDFAELAHRATVLALQRSGVHLLQPYLSFELSYPSLYNQNVMKLLAIHQGIIADVWYDKQRTTVLGSVSAKNERGITKKLVTVTEGYGNWISEYSHYDI